jgi:hypothetical protein
MWRLLICHFIRVADSILMKDKDNPSNRNNAIPTDYVGNHMTYIEKSFDSPFPIMQIWKTTNMRIEKVIRVPESKPNSLI